MLKYGLAHKNQKDKSEIARKAAIAKWAKYQGKGYEPKPIILRDLATIFKILHIEPIKEYKFHPTRRWRFDYVLLEQKIAIEYEGIFSAKSRHTSIKGFDNDCEKYNIAAIMGWKVLRITAISLRDGRAFNHIETALKGGHE